MPKPIDLKDGIPVLKICLKKSWAKKSTYWVEVWQAPLKINQQVTKTQWVCVRSWRFSRKNQSTGKMEEINGSLPSEGKSSFYLALEQVVSGVAIQLEKDYTIDIVQNNIESIKLVTEYVGILDEIKRAIKQWSNLLHKSIPLVFSDGSAIVIDGEKAQIRNKESFELDTLKKILKSPFKEAQHKRAKKARW